MNESIQEKERREGALYAGGVTFYFFITVVHFFWAISGPLTKMSYAGLGISGVDVLEIIHFAGIRLLGAGLIGLAYCRLRGTRLLPEHLSDLWQLTKLGLMMGVAQYIFFNFGAAFSSGVQTSILSSAGAFFGILISAFLFREDALTGRKITGCILGVFAVVILNWEDIRQGAAASLFGALLLLLGQLSGSHLPGPQCHLGWRMAVCYQRRPAGHDRGLRRRCVLVYSRERRASAHRRAGSDQRRGTDFFQPAL